MTPLRFRAWDGKKMRKVLNLCFHGKPTATLQYGPVIKHWNDNLHIMQSTGLTDKNGVEIFEGDVVNVVNPSMSPLFIRWNSERAMFTVGSHSNWFFMQMADLDGGPARFEVIGNIYQNPELLSSLPSL